MMERIEGRRMYIFSGNHYENLTPVAESTDCTLSLDSETIALCRRGDIDRKRAGLLSWGVECRGFYAFEDSPLLRLSQLFGQPYSVGITVLQRDLVLAGIPLDRVALDKEVTLVGLAILSSAEVAGGKAGLSSVRVGFTGSGEPGILAQRNGFPYILPIRL